VVAIRTPAITLINKGKLSGCSLCSRQSSSITSELAVLLRPSPCCPCLRRVVTAFLFPSQGGRARLHPSPP
jgi:hypothetical protein